MNEGDMTIERISALLSSSKNLKIAVVGDFCLDVYWNHSSTKKEVSVETLKDVYPVSNFRCSLGGAGNLVNNLYSLGVREIDLFGIIGDDIFGREMCYLLSQNNINQVGLKIQKSNWATSVYMKPMQGAVEQNRLDLGSDNLVSREVQDLILKDLNKSLASYDVVLVNQQLMHGLFTKEFCEQLAKSISKHQSLFLVDSRNYFHEFSGSVRKMNEYEACSLLDPTISPLASLNSEKVLDAGCFLTNVYNKPLVVTRGQKGVNIFSANNVCQISGLSVDGEIDAVGAGDSFFAGFAVGYALSNDTALGGVLGNLCSAVTIQKIGTTGTACKSEVEDVYYKNEGKKMIDGISSKDFESFGFEKLMDTKSDDGIKHAIFDHDGTLSTLRRGWEEVMASVMSDCIKGDLEVSAELSEQINHSVQELIKSSMGCRTIVQMELMIELIRSFALVPENKILDKLSYKKYYLSQLMLVVQKNLDAVKKDSSCSEAFRIEGAFEFLSQLKEKGVSLYLASGTDEEDVKIEAELMGYAHLFDGGIYGARHDYDGDIKRFVLQKISDSLGSSKLTSVVVFGDGPVEIAEGRSFGAITIGVASDEEKRNSLNLEKRKRLINVGAHAIIADYKNAQEILSLLNFSKA